MKEEGNLGKKGLSLTRRIEWHCSGSLQFCRDAGMKRREGFGSPDLVPGKRTKVVPFRGSRMVTRVQIYVRRTRGELQYSVREGGMMAREVGPPRPPLGSSA